MATYSQGTKILLKMSFIDERVTFHYELSYNVHCTKNFIPLEYITPQIKRILFK